MTECISERPFIPSEDILTNIAVPGPGSGNLSLPEKASEDMAFSAAGEKPMFNNSGQQGETQYPPDSQRNPVSSSLCPRRLIGEKGKLVLYISQEERVLACR